MRVTRLFFANILYWQCLYGCRIQSKENAMRIAGRNFIFILTTLLSLLVPAVAGATQRQAGFQLPDTVEVRQVTIWSGSSRLDGDLYLPKDLDPNEKRPAIVMSHGWGGTKLKLRREAAKFSAAGYIALTFTYRGWGNSEGKIILVDGMPELDESNEATVKVRFVRELVDPMDWIQDFRAALDYIDGEPQVDTSRIGAWGTSYGGGIVIWSAANDDRIAVVVSQVGAMIKPTGGMKTLARQRAVDAAREGVDTFFQDKIENLKGTPNYAKMLQYDAVSMASRIKVPTLLIDAELEQLFDRQDAGSRVFDIIRSHGTTPAHYEVFPGIKHWEIYSKGFQRGTDLALEWFNQYLRDGN